jgi:hypothetical protein
MGYYLIRQKGTTRMNQQPQEIFIGAAPQKRSDQEVHGEFVALLGEPFYQIHNFDAMDPFFMSIVSSSDHWLFISSTGGLSAGRASAEQAIFPYYTDDKLTENSENTGNKAILLVSQASRTSLWEPFSHRQQGSYAIERNLYKNVTGTALVFEEHNLDLGLTYRYAWRTGDQFGFIKTTWVMNTGDTPCQVELIDGLQNILPAHITSVTQNTFSPLLDAYKRSELHAGTGLALFTLNSRLTDLPEPSESLLATTVAQVGLTNPGYLLSSDQLDDFRTGNPVETETEVRGRRGAYFVHTVLDLAPGAERSWHLIADASQDAAAVVQKIQWLCSGQESQRQALEKDIAGVQQKLWEIVASADGVQRSNHAAFTAHHFANVMFNTMRGGIFTDQYWVQSSDFIDFVSVHNRPVLEAHADFFAGLPDKVHVSELQARAEAAGTNELIRLSYAYLPLTFSRRHGDPSRPWNRFAINIKQPDGSRKLDYEGNWRDIFQNWEALAYSYPEFIESMISTFLNATTADGYNPYRITHHGVDWEVPEPSNPWANTGYWSDHQIIYLQKLMEISSQVHPGKLQEFLTRSVFSYANVPYRIKPYEALLKDPHSTIDFDWEMERLVETRVSERGTDGKLVYTSTGEIHLASLAEKLLTLLLAKLVNFVPEGGIWMNTQRPEWNDANNALVGKGLSVVTLCYLRRYILFCKELFTSSGSGAVPLNNEVQQFYAQVADILKRFSPILPGSFDDEQRRAMMDELGKAGSRYRWNFYNNGFSSQTAQTAAAEIAEFLELAQQYVEHSLRANQRSDQLYHTYNILHLHHGMAAITHLYEMLEGQVAVLSSGYLSAAESLALLERLRNSPLYRADQHSYILYPDRALPSFLGKNSITGDQVSGIALFSRLVEAHDRSIIVRDLNGGYHFSGDIRNFKDVERALSALRKKPEFDLLVENDFGKIKTLFEEVFHHNEFTGRSGTFFAYEGLGSIYWHMVSKLLLAVQETAVRYRNEHSAGALRERYEDIKQGLGFYKSPAVYGAFPTDPYSHTPKGQGAKQPGMTGAVKEEILARITELGCSVENGRLVFDPGLLDHQELLTHPAEFSYLDVNGKQQKLDLDPSSLAYTICQTPVILRADDEMRITISFRDGSMQEVEGNTLDDASSKHIFERDGVVRDLTISFPISKE